MSLHKRRLRGVDVLFFLNVLLLVYIGVALFVYAFRHPDLTATQVLLDFEDAMCWR